MKSFKYINARLLVILVMTLVIVLSATHNVKAQGIVVGDTVAAGTTISGDGFFYGNNVTISGTVDGDVMAIGREVVIDGTVNGSLVVLGENLTINGEVGGTIYSAAVQLVYGSEANSDRNLYFAGFSLNTEEGSIVGRDLYAASLGAQFAGTVEGEVQAIIGPAEFFYLIMDRIDTSGLLSYSPSFAPNGALFASGSHPGAGLLGMSSIGTTSLQPALAIMTGNEHQSTGVDWPVVGEWFLERLRELVTLFVFGLLGLWLIPQVIPGSADKLRANPLPSTGWGLLALVIAFNLLGVVLLIAFIIVTIGLFLGFATLWELAWAFMALGIFSLGLAATIFALFVLYFSKAIVAYFIGNLILTRLAPKTTKYKALSLLLGLVIYVLLAAVPILGWVIGLGFTALGLGAAWLYYRNTRKTALEAEDEATPEIKSEEAAISDASSEVIEQG
jgi:cytoskeletal protein CcmA (bactofilin family)